MKKIFSTLTLVLCLVAMVSCGGKKEDKTAPQTDSLKAKDESFCEATMVAEEEGDYETIERINAEVEAYYNSLSDEDKQKFEEYVMEIVEAEYDYDDTDEYVEEVVDDAYEYADKMTSDVYEYAEEMTENAYEYADKMTSAAYKYADKMTEDAYEYAEKAMEDAYEYAEKAMEDANDFSDDFDW